MFSGQHSSLSHKSIISPLKSDHYEFALLQVKLVIFPRVKSLMNLKQQKEKGLCYV